MRSYQNVVVILHFASEQPLSEEQATQAIACFLRQQGNCEPVPIGWDIGVPHEADPRADWVKACCPPSLPLADTPYPSPRRDQGWLD